MLAFKRLKHEARGMQHEASLGGLLHTVVHKRHEGQIHDIKHMTIYVSAFQRLLNAVPRLG